MISVNIATHKKREKYLQHCIESVLACKTVPDTINVYLNDYKAPKWLNELAKKNPINILEAPKGDLGAAAKFYCLESQDEGIYITLDDDLIADRSYVGYLADSAYRFPSSVVGLHGTRFLKFPIKDWYNHHGEKHIDYCYHGLAQSKVVHCLGTGVMAFRVGLIKHLKPLETLINYPRMCDPAFMKICLENSIKSVCLVRADGLVKEQAGSQETAIWKGLIDKKNTIQTELVNSIPRKRFYHKESVFQFADYKLTDANITWNHVKEIASIVNSKSKLVEFGSGRCTPYFAELSSSLISFEHDTKYLSKYSVYRPLRNGWYSLSDSDVKKCQNADVLIIDGPLGEPYGERYNFNMDCLPKKGFIFVDDCDRPKDLNLAKQIHDKSGGKMELIKAGKKTMAKIMK